MIHPLVQGSSDPAHGIAHVSHACAYLCDNAMILPRHLPYMSEFEEM